jgi:hypothetical protein
MLWVPPRRAFVVYVHEPLESEQVPSVVEPSLTVIVPVPALGVTDAVKMTEPLYVDGLVSELMAVTLEALFTTWLTVLLVAVLWFTSPLYTAVSEWVPARMLEMTRDPEPRATVDVPMVIDPFLKVMVPVPLESPRLAVRMMALLKVEGFVFEASVTVMSAAFTACVRAELVEVRKFAFPPYTAVML